MMSTPTAIPQSELKVINIFYWKVQLDINSKDPGYITENLKSHKCIQEIIPHYSIPGQLTLTLKTKCTCSEFEMKDFLIKLLSRSGAENISLTLVETR